MDRASSLIFPGSRTIAGWWRQLAPHEPLAFAIGYAYLHRIEAPVNVSRDQPVDPLVLLVLQALALESEGAAAETEVLKRLHLPAAILRRLLADMERDGLVTCTGKRWQVSEHGRLALERRSISVQVQERRILPYLENLDCAGQRVGPPVFAPVTECVGAPWQVDESLGFDTAELQHCIGQTRAWKQAHAFPIDIENLANGPHLEAWQRVIVDRPERVMLTLIRTDKDVKAFAVKADGWSLLDRIPVLCAAAPSEAIWPPEPPMAVWQEAWRAWCKQRQLPAGEVDNCTLAMQPPRLEVRAPSRLVQRLQAAKSDLFKGDAWLLAGDGYIRPAAQLAVRAG